MTKRPKTGGRKAGTPNKSTRSLKDAFLALKFDIPAELVSLFRDPDLLPAAKLRILEMLLPYVAPRLKESEVVIESAPTSDPTATLSTDHLLALVPTAK